MSARAPNAASIQVRPGGAEVLEDVLPLLDSSFETLSDGEEDEFRRSLVIDAAEAGTLLVAEGEGRLIGFRAFGRVRQYPRVEEAIEQSVYYAQHPELEDVLRSGLRIEAAKLGLTGTIVEYFESPFTDPDYRVGFDPFFGSSLVVVPSFRRGGLGARLNRVSMEMTRELGGTEFFAFVVTPSPAEAIGVRQGVHRVLRVGPVTPAGSCRLLFGLPIRSPGTEPAD